MKRHDKLIPLTHDHHHALAQARRLRLHSDSAPEERRSSALEFLDFFYRETLMHFREEEEIVFPLVVNDPEVEVALMRVAEEHLWIHGLVRQLAAELNHGSPATETMKSIATMLESHIRFEEKTLFPLIERLAPTGLIEIELSPRERTRAATSEGKR